MLSLFQRKRALPIAGTPPTSAIETPKGLMRPKSRRPRLSINNPESAAPAKMDLFVDLKVLAVGGSQWTAAERQREEKSLCGNDLQTLLDFFGDPQNDAVERVKGTAPGR
ncbi:hypothetical protein MXC99_03890 [Thauera aromatica]|uniref:hypothetical protein n=1 Tax=Thauera aromatica TaxID=59405 RepID=UPI001FFC323B|nr:hypothetical protein [Thauera aromatica]MCK2087321.1 hypothetical protein [Thauera aromatica]